MHLHNAYEKMIQMMYIYILEKIQWAPRSMTGILFERLLLSLKVFCPDKELYLDSSRQGLSFGE